MLEIISVIVSIVCAGGSFISFLLAQKEKREAIDAGRKAMRRQRYTPKMQIRPI